MSNNLSVKVTADVADLNAKFAVASATANALGSDLRKLAAASASGIIDPAGAAKLQQVSGDFVVAKNRVAAMREELKATQTTTNGLGGALEGVRSGISRAFAVTGIAAAGAAVMKVGEEITELGERAIQIRSMSEVLGVTTSQFQAMAVAGDEAGVSAEVFARASEKLTNMLTEARAGSGKSIEQLHALGISTGDIANKSFQLNDVLAVLKQRLEDTSSAESTRKALLQELGARTALAIQAIKEYDGSQQGVAAAMAKINGLSEEQINRLAQMKAGWNEMRETASNNIAQVAAWIGNLVNGPLNAYKRAVLANNPTLTPGGQASGGSVTGTIDRSGAPTQEQQAAQESDRQQAAIRAQALQDEMAKIKEGVSAFASGTSERLAALRQYAADAKKYYGSDNVDEVRKANSEVLAAEREYRQTQGSEAIADARTQAQALQANTSLSLSQRLEAERAIWTTVLSNDRLSAAQRLEAAREFSREYTEIAKQTAAQAATIARQDATADIALSRMKIEAEKNALQLGTAANAQAVAERLSQLRTLTATEFALNEQELENELRNLQQDTAEHDRVYNEIRELKAKLVLDLEALDREAAEASKKYTKEQSTLWKSSVNEIESAEGNLVGDVLNRRQSLSQSLRQIGAQMVTQEITNDIKAFTTKKLLDDQSKAMEQGGLLFHLVNQTQAAQATVQSQAVQTSATAAGNTARLSADTSAAAASKAVGAAQNGPTVMADAAKAFSGTYAAVAQIPYVGWILAPAAAAAAFAAVAAYEGLASLDVGTNYVAKGGLAMIHEGEAVVPKAYNPAAGGDGGGGYSEQHNYNGDINLSALDARGLRSLLSGPSGRSAVVAAARNYISRGGGRR
jgi:hypothetical protein